MDTLVARPVDRGDTASRETLEESGHTDRAVVSGFNCSDLVL